MGMVDRTLEAPREGFTAALGDWILSEETLVTDGELLPVVVQHAAVVGRPRAHARPARAPAAGGAGPVALGLPRSAPGQLAAFLPAHTPGGGYGRARKKGGQMERCV